MKDTKIQWHPGFVAAMSLELKENKNDLVFEKEYNLNTKPLEVDLLIIKKDVSVRISNEIGSFFRGHFLGIPLCHAANNKVKYNRIQISERQSGY